MPTLFELCGSRGVPWVPPGFAVLRGSRWLQQAGTDLAPGRLSATELAVPAGKGSASWVSRAFFCFKPAGKCWVSAGFFFFFFFSPIVLLHPSRLNSVVGPV